MAEFIIFNRLYPIIQCNKHGKNIGDDVKGEENEREKLVRIYLYFFANRLSRCDDHSGEIDEKGCAVEFLTKPLKRVARISTHTRTLRSADAWRKLRSPPPATGPIPTPFRRAKRAHPRPRGVSATPFCPRFERDSPRYRLLQSIGLLRHTQPGPLCALGKVSIRVWKGGKIFFF